MDAGLLGLGHIWQTQETKFFLQMFLEWTEHDREAVT